MPTAAPRCTTCPLRRPRASGALDFLAVILSESFQTDAATGETRRVGHDPLTGLPDRALLADRVEQNILNAPARQQIHRLLVMGLDRFTLINDAGLRAGDQLLKEVASGCRR